MIKKYFDTHPNEYITPWFTHPSSFIQCIQYDKSECILYVKIHSEVYHYNVSLDLANAFSLASSWGHFYDTRIKNKHGETKHKSVNKQLMKSVASIKTTSISTTKYIQENPNDTATKNVLGTVWGIAEMGLVFLPLPVSTPLRIGIAAGSMFAGTYLQTKGIEAPLAVDIALDVAVGYSIFAGLSRIGGRGAAYYASAKTPFVNVGYKAGVVKATVTPTQAAAGILFGGNLWKKAIVDMEQKAAATTASRISAINKLTEEFIAVKALKPTLNIQMPGTTSKYFLNPTELKEFDNMASNIYKQRKVGKVEKVLDYTIKNQKYIAGGLGAGYSIYNTIQDINEHKQEKKVKKNEPKKFEVSISQTGLSVATTILNSPKRF